jgi:AcrR family transcriptional regulator
MTVGAAPSRQSERATPRTNLGDGVCAPAPHGKSSAARVRKRGRAEATRKVLLLAARRAFIRFGYRVSIRAIAADTGYDPALFYRHFGSKADLFRQAFDRHQLVRDPKVPRSSFGEHLARRLLTGRQGAFDLVQVAVRSAGEPEALAVVVDLFERRLAEPLAARLDGPQAMERAKALIALGSGVHLLRGALSARPAERETLIKLLGRAFQDVIDR